MALFVENKQHFMVEFLKWLGENKWYKYKDGKWFTTTDIPYIGAQPRKFYTEEEVVQIFSTITPKL
jgi:hypothetical protein